MNLTKVYHQLEWNKIKYSPLQNSDAQLRYLLEIFDYQRKGKYFLIVVFQKTWKTKFITSHTGWTPLVRGGKFKEHRYMQIYLGGENHVISKEQ